MKKLLLILTCFLLTAGALFAQQNDQKVWNVDSQVYKDMVSLYLYEGYALPSSVGPWSTDELKGMLNKVSDGIETDASRALYNKIHDELYKNNRVAYADSFGADFEVSVVPEVYVHTNPGDYTQEEDWFYGYNNRSWPVNFEYGIYAADNMYLESGFNVGYESGRGNSTQPNTLYAPMFNVNIPFLGSGGLDYINFNFPKTAFVSFGGSHWNVLLGRDTVRWGNGETGNLYLGGNQNYDNTIRFTTYFDNFKYSYVTNFSAHPESVLNNNSQNDLENGTKAFMAHRFDFWFLNNRMNFAVTEGIMYQSADNVFDVRFFNPMMFYHNTYIRANANSLLGFDADFAVCKGLNLYGQLVIDEGALPGEPTTASPEGGRPGKMGGMLGVKYAMPVADGTLRFNLEGVYTDPYLYLREEYDSTTGQNGVSLYDYTREFHQNTPTIAYNRAPVGYRYGGDCIVGDFKANYTTSKNWVSELELFYMAHGIIYNDFEGDDWAYGTSHTPSTTDIAETPSHPDGYVERTFRASLSSSYPVSDWLSVSGGIDNVCIWNKDNLSKPLSFDMQLHAQVKITF